MISYNSLSLQTVDQRLLTYFYALMDERDPTLSGAKTAKPGSGTITESLKTPIKGKCGI